MAEIALAVIVAAIVLALLGLLAVMVWDFRDDDYAAMDRRLAKKAARREAEQGRSAG